VTDWKNYDTIYTERYMRTPQENPDGYRDGSCLTYAGQLKGKLLIQHGLIDDNVHPTNTWQLIEKFHEENVPFDLMIYPTSRHGIRFREYSSNLRMEYFITHLKPEPINP
jgi:dipeptidyl-peptidase-4